MLNGSCRRDLAGALVAQAAGRHLLLSGLPPATARQQPLPLPLPLLQASGGMLSQRHACIRVPYWQASTKTLHERELSSLVGAHLNIYACSLQ